MNRNSQEISFLDFMAPFLKMWWLIVLLVIVGGISSFYITKYQMVPVYEAKTTLFIGRDTDVMSGLNMSDLQLDNKLVLDYKELIKTEMLTDIVIEDLELNISHLDLVDNLELDAMSDSRFISIIYTGTSPKRVETIVNKFSETLVIQAQNIVGVDNIMIVDYAKVPTYPIGPSVTINMLVSIVIALLIAIVIIFILDKLDNRIKSKKDIEDILGISVLCEIPKIKGVK